MAKIFLVADTHFNHQNIIKYCNRPFKNVEQMNEAIISNWNNIVTNDDIVYHLGDFGFGTFEELQTIFNKLNGQKYLIMGNHDYRAGKKYYEKIGFIEVYKKEHKLGNILLTHYPKKVDENIFNYYGHIHDKKESDEFKDGKHKCISLEKTDYKPFLLSGEQ